MPRLMNRGRSASIILLIIASAWIGGCVGRGVSTAPECSDGIDNNPADGDGQDSPLMVNVSDYYGDGNPWGDWDSAPANDWFDQSCTFTSDPPSPFQNPHFLACPLWDSETIQPSSISECLTGA